MLVSVIVAPCNEILKESVLNLAFFHNWYGLGSLHHSTPQLVLLLSNMNNIQFQVLSQDYFNEHAKEEFQKSCPQFSTTGLNLFFLWMQLNVGCTKQWLLPLQSTYLSTAVSIMTLSFLVNVVNTCLLLPGWIKRKILFLFMLASNLMPWSHMHWEDIIPHKITENTVKVKIYFFNKRWRDEMKGGGANHPYLQPLGWIMKDADQHGQDKGILKAYWRHIKGTAGSHYSTHTCPQLRCKGWFYWGGKTRVPGGKPSKHSRDQLQLYSHDTQVRESTQGYH